MSAAELFGLDVYKIETELDGDNPDNASYSVIFKDAGKTFTELLIYLSLFVGEYIPVGIYKNIE